MDWLYLSPLPSPPRCRKHSIEVKGCSRPGTTRAAAASAPGCPSRWVDCWLNWTQVKGVCVGHVRIIRSRLLSGAYLPSWTVVYPSVCPSFVLLQPASLSEAGEQWLVFMFAFFPPLPSPSLLCNTVPITTHPSTNQHSTWIDFTHQGKKPPLVIELLPTCWRVRTVSTEKLRHGDGHKKTANLQYCLPSRQVTIGWVRGGERQCWSGRPSAGGGITDQWRRFRVHI